MSAPFTLAPLPWDEDALALVISAQNLTREGQAVRSAAA